MGQQSDLWPGILGQEWHGAGGWTYHGMSSHDVVALVLGWCWGQVEGEMVAMSVSSVVLSAMLSSEIRERQH